MAAYEYIFIWDEDLGVEHFNADKYITLFAHELFLSVSSKLGMGIPVKLTSYALYSRYINLVKKHGLEISQPGLEPNNGLTWQMTKRRGDKEVHK